MKKTLSFIGRNLGSLLLALVLATTVWVTAISQVDPDEVRNPSFSVPVTVVNLQPDLVAQGYEQAGVELTLRAPQSVWRQLQPGDIQLLLDLEGKSEGEYDVPLKAVIDRSPMRVDKITPAVMHITIDRLLLRMMDIRVEMSGNPAAGFQVGVPALVPEQVELSGPAVSVDRVVSIVAPIDVDGLRNTINQNVTLLALDTEGNSVSGVRVNPAAISVTLPVQQLGGYRDLVVKPDIIGAVRTGYRLTGLTVTPMVVTLYSDNPEAIRVLPGYVMTQPLDISGAQDNISRSLLLVLPAGVQVVGDPQILVQVSISAIEDSIKIIRTVRMQGLASDLSAVLSPSAVDVLLSGPVPALNLLLLRPSDIDVYIDLTGYGPGTYQLKPTVNPVNVELRLVTTSPEQIEVTIQLKSSP